jgi:hypothetical protein
MAAGEARAISPADLERGVLAVATHFETDTVYVIGSQALLVTSDDVARDLRFSEEIDLYAGNHRAWEAKHVGIEASEEIHGLFGEGSQFHATFGFFLDGVDETTARLPPDWMDRAKRKLFTDGTGKQVTAIAPSAADLVAAKLVRGDEKDLEFAAGCIGSGLAKNADIKSALKKSLSGDHLIAALRLVDRASRLKNAPRKGRRR